MAPTTDIAIALVLISVWSLAHMPFLTGVHDAVVLVRRILQLER